MGAPKPKGKEERKESENGKSEKSKKRKKKKKGVKATEDLFKPIEESQDGDKLNAKMSWAAPKPKLVPTPMGGQMPHEKGFNKGRPWGAMPKSPPKKAVISRPKIQQKSKPR